MKLIETIAAIDSGDDLLHRFGENLVIVRVYRDELLQKQIKTVELLLEETAGDEPTKCVRARLLRTKEEPPQVLTSKMLQQSRHQRYVFLQLDEPSTETVRALHAAGGCFHEPSGAWVILRERAEAMGLLAPEVFAWIVNTLPAPLSVGI